MGTTLSENDGNGGNSDSCRYPVLRFFCSRPGFVRMGTAGTLTVDPWIHLHLSVNLTPAGVALGVAKIGTRLWALGHADAPPITYRA